MEEMSDLTTEDTESTEAATPETNAAERMAFSGEYMVPTKVARRLERQRDDAREIARLLCARRGTQLEFLPTEDEE